MKNKIIEAFRDPVKNLENVVNLLIGGILTFFPIINLIALGFLSEKLRKSIEQDKSPLRWDENIKVFLLQGFYLLAIGLGYLVLPFLLLFLGGVFMATLSDGRLFSIFYFRGQVLNLLGTLVLLSALYLMFFGVCLFLEEKKLQKAFDIKTIADKIILVIKDYSVVYSVIIGSMIVSAIVILLLTNVVIGYLLSGFIVFYNGLVITNLLSKFFPRQSVSISLCPKKMQKRAE